MAVSPKLSNKAAALAGRSQASSGREGQAFRSQPGRGTNLRRQNHCSSPRANQHPLLLVRGGTPGGLQALLPRRPQPGQGGSEPASAPLDRPLAEPSSLHAPGQCPTGAPTQRRSLPRGTDSSSGAKRGGTQASHPRRQRQPPAPAQLPRTWGQPSQGWGRTGLQHSPAGPGGRAAAQSVIFKPFEPSPVLSFPYPLLHVPDAGLAVAAPPLPPRASQPSRLPGLGRRGPSTHPAPLEAMKPGQRPQAGSGCPGCAVACRAGLQGLQEHEGEDISPSATPSCCKTVWLQLTNPPKLIRALQMCRHPGQPRCQPVPSREEGCTRLSSTLSPGAANPGCSSPSHALHPEAPPMLHGARETHSGT